MLVLRRRFGVVRPGRRGKQCSLLAVKERHPAVVSSEWAGADPDDLARAEQFVEQPRRIAREPGRENVALQHAGRQRHTLELADDLVEAIESTRHHGRADPLPVGKEAGERVDRRRLDLFAEDRKRALPQLPEHIRVAPLPPGAVGTELPRQQRAIVTPAQQARLDDVGRHTESRGNVVGGKRPVGAGIANQQAAERRRRVNRIDGARPGEKGRGEARRNAAAKRFGVAARVFGGNVAVLRRDAHENDAPLFHKCTDLLDYGHRTALDSQRELVRRKVADAAEKIMNRIGGAGMTTRVEALQLVLHRREGPGFEQLAQFFASEQISEHVAVQRECCSPTLGQRRVTVIHEVGDVAEGQRRRERRRMRHVEAHHPHLASPDLVEQSHQRRHVEGITKALAVGLEHDWEAGIARRHLEKIGTALTLTPQRCARARPTPGQQERTRRVLPEPGGEQRGVAELVHEQLVEFVGVDHAVVGRRRLVGLGEADHDAVVAPDRPCLHTEPITNARLDGHRPWRVHLGAERRKEAELPVTELVAESLHHDLTVRGQVPSRCLSFLSNVGAHISCGERVEVESLTEHVVVHLLNGADELADGLAELERPPDLVAVPERHLARNSGRGRDDDSIRRDVLDPPRGRAEQERLADA